MGESRKRSTNRCTLRAPVQSGLQRSLSPGRSGTTLSLSSSAAVGR